jgi:VIT1/CCC1 family predicted Fe2+/Mn2+ transporter
MLTCRVQQHDHLHTEMQKEMAEGYTATFSSIYSLVLAAAIPALLALPIPELWLYLAMYAGPDRSHD